MTGRIVWWCLWLLIGCGLLLIGLWPWLANEHYRAWERAVSPPFAPARPGEPIMLRVDVLLHLAMVLAIAAWMSAALQRWAWHWGWWGPVLAIGVAWSDEVLQGFLGQGQRSIDPADMLGDLCGAAVVVLALCLQWRWRQRQGSATSASGPTTTGQQWGNPQSRAHN